MELEVEEKGINLLNEYSLHSLIKHLYSLPGDRFEVRVGTYIIDVVRGDILIEIQTRSFSSIRDKLRTLVKTHEVRLIHPIIVQKWVVYVDKDTGKKLGKRKSPRKGKPIDLFRELIRMPGLVKHPNLSIILYMVQAEETRIRGVKKGWRGRGYKILDRRIIGVDEVISLNHPGDYLRFLPDGLDNPFTNKMLAHEADIRIREAGWITYCLKKMGAIQEVGKRGRELLFRIT
ncbi:MAG: hypothetical protein KAS67_07220 [Thermoplasmata archaeon]|nr:hypothetical protein [Thermoplasmata archaeon]